MPDHREHLENLRRTLDAAATSGNNAVIPPKQAREGAEAIREIEEKANKASKWPAADQYGFTHFSNYEEYVKAVAGAKHAGEK